MGGVDSSPAVELRGVTVWTESALLLDDIHWTLARGARSAILGPNGSGKTTLLRIVTGYRFPTEGTVRVLGEELGRVDLDVLRRRLGIVDPTFEHLMDHRLRVLDLVLAGFFGHYTIDFDEPTRAQVAEGERMLADVGLARHAHRIFSTLSTGEQRRALLARAMAGEPDILILDEPTAGLDLLARETLLATVDRLHAGRPGMTVLTVTHHLEELLPGTSNVLLLKQGRVTASGHPEDVLQPMVLEEVFGVPVGVRHESGRWEWHVKPTAWGSLVGDVRE
jgi:iron complex transport system ATP-binding protein